jgi:uncharacterized OsmC-like protein
MMKTADVGAAVRRVEALLQRRPEMGLQDDEPVTAHWDGGTRVVSTHANGTQVVTDMPGQLGGSGEQVTPTWLLRASLASCAVTRIAMAAAAEGIQLTVLQVEATSRSDARGIFGMAAGEDATVPAAPRDVRLHVRLAAPGVPGARLRKLAEGCAPCSPVSAALRDAVPVAVDVDIDEDSGAAHRAGSDPGGGVS